MKILDKCKILLENDETVEMVYVGETQEQYLMSEESKINNEGGIIKMGNKYATSFTPIPKEWTKPTQENGSWVFDLKEVKL